MTPFAQFLVWMIGIIGASTVGVSWARAWADRKSSKDGDE